MKEEQKKTLAFAIYALALQNIPMGEFLERSLVCINDSLNKCSSCGNNYPEICGICVSDIAQRTAEQAI